MGLARRTAVTGEGTFYRAPVTGTAEVERLHNQLYLVSYLWFRDNFFIFYFLFLADLLS